MPIAKGHKMLVGIKKLEERTEGGLFLPDKVKDEDEQSAIHGVVLSQGKDCYVGDKLGASEKWCEVGDQIFFKPYCGVYLKSKRPEYDGYNLRMINDVDMNGVVEPGDVTENLDKIER